MPAEEATVAPAPHDGGSAGDGGTIYVLLPVHDRRALTEQFARCLAEQTDRGFHLVLIDDGSTDGTAEAVTAQLPGTTVLRGTGSWWWAGSLQRGRDWLLGHGVSAGDIVLIANDDTRFDREFLAAGRAALGRARRSMVLARLHDDRSGELVEVGVRVSWARLRFQGVLDVDRVNCMSTRGLFLYATEFLELGGFHPRLLPHYLSDYEFTIRARRRGFALTSDPAVRLWYDPTTTGVRSRPAGPLRRYLRVTLSPRYAANPVYWTTFLGLACPRRYLVQNVLRVWWRYAKGAWAARHTPAGT